MVVGRKGLIFDNAFLGTNSMSPGCSTGSSCKLWELNIFFVLMILASVHSSETRLNRSTWECFADP